MCSICLQVQFADLDDGVPALQGTRRVQELLARLLCAEQVPGARAVRPERARPAVHMKPEPTKGKVVSTFKCFLSNTA